MSEINSIYIEQKHPITQDIMWMIEDVSLPSGDVSALMERFISLYPHPDYSLSIFDSNTSNTIEIDCPTSEMPKIVEYIYHSEKGFPLVFIGLNSLSDSYVVRMSISKGNIPFGSYVAKDGKLMMRE